MEDIAHFLNRAIAFIIFDLYMLYTSTRSYPEQFGAPHTAIKPHISLDVSIIELLVFHLDEPPKTDVSVRAKNEEGSKP
jgi:hypothetical protein